MARQRTVAIRQGIIDDLEDHPKDIIAHTAAIWRITREAARLHVVALENEGVITSEGRTSAKRFRLNAIAKDDFLFNTAGLEEHVVWRDHVRPLIEGAPKNAIDLCDIAVTEMVNNVIDHSESPDLFVSVTYTAATIDIGILDHGVGIFRKIRKACNLNEDREAILELSKGKLTTAPAQHSGYGVFFTSRMVDLFRISSGRLMFSHEQPNDDWMIEQTTPDKVPSGTYVQITVATSTQRTPNEVYNRFCVPWEDDDLGQGFTRTHVPVSLAQYGDEKLISRSQAKRVLARFEKFTEVLLDFRGVEFIGQGFADEIFRVFPSNHPEVQIRYVNASDNVRRMIHLAMSTDSPRQRKLF